MTANDVRIINQKNRRTRRLPDFRNLGVALRVLLAVNFLGVLTVLVRSARPGDLFEGLVLTSGRLELPLLLALLVLYLLQPVLERLSFERALGTAGFIVIACALLSESLLGSSAYERIGAMSWAIAAGALVLVYFDYRALRFSPAESEARLLALTARIRPHFLFNSLNAVLGVIRSDPRRAETALEEMADMFRVVMRDNRELVTLDDELKLCERYLDLERLRLGERLLVEWSVDACPGDALIPPLLLQPLVENAVYHGIEPSAEPGTVTIAGELKSGELRLEVANPLSRSTRHQAGNRMALDNIRERLMLFYDLEASLGIEKGLDTYVIRIRLPYRRKSP
ncbi:sensor histidine kinase [Cognatazoarcus halotolerans]|uniref:sensor histidine kinase n=1 Tax=Cognatazoarcus halotolerans TaxID=2686016 RepID=UPI001357E586|nr:histidine kinase [Cognatazoarcus halotolerans]MBX3679648.1 histidine kinase [Rhodocyclaceae bacterium]MCB1899736.1 histidine kinase [Rhodocyclaceae bacterium]MCP5308606.1 histidine kinase [Zoogloeaceae bacterium]